MVKAIKASFATGNVSPKDAMGLTDEMVENMYGQAYRLYNTGRYTEAAQMFRLLVMINPSEFKYTFGLAACMHLLKEYRNAIELYAICATLDRDSPLPLYHLSDCYLQIQDKLSALVTLEMLVKRAEANPDHQMILDRARMTLNSVRKDLERDGTLKPGGTS